MLLDRQAVRVGGAHREALRQEQLVSEVLDTVDFGVIRLPPRVRSSSRTMRSSASAASPDSFLAAAVTAVTDEKLVPLDPQQHPLVRLQRQESFDDVVLWFALADGRRRAFAFAGRHLTDHNGAPAGAVLIVRDITAGGRPAGARRLRRLDLPRACTPLTSILGYLELASTAADSRMPRAGTSRPRTATASGCSASSPTSCRRRRGRGRRSIRACTSSST
jgi:hypothetical protein